MPTETSVASGKNVSVLYISLRHPCVTSGLAPRSELHAAFMFTAHGTEPLNLVHELPKILKGNEGKKLGLGLTSKVGASCECRCEVDRLSFMVMKTEVSSVNEEEDFQPSCCLSLAETRVLDSCFLPVRPAALWLRSRAPLGPRGGSGRLVSCSLLSGGGT